MFKLCLGFLVLFLFISSVYSCSRFYQGSVEAEKIDGYNEFVVDKYGNGYWTYKDSEKNKSFVLDDYYKNINKNSVDVVSVLSDISQENYLKKKLGMDKIYQPQFKLSDERVFTNASLGNSGYYFLDGELLFVLDFSGKNLDEMQFLYPTNYANFFVSSIGEIESELVRDGVLGKQKTSYVYVYSQTGLLVKDISGVVLDWKSGMKPKFASTKKGDSFAFVVNRDFYYGTNLYKKCRNIITYGPVEGDKKCYEFISSPAYVNKEIVLFYSLIFEDSNYVMSNRYCELVYNFTGGYTPNSEDYMKVFWKTDHISSMPGEKKEILYDKLVKLQKKYESKPKVSFYFFMISQMIWYPRI